MDVERSEWQWLQDPVSNQFHQIIIELHVLPVILDEFKVPYKNDSGEDVWAPKSVYFQQFFNDFSDEVNQALFDTYLSGLRNLLRDYLIFHIHANNSVPILFNLGGRKWPPLFELSLVRKDLAPDAVPSVQTFPVPGLDYPNKTDRPDYPAILPFDR